MKKSFSNKSVLLAATLFVCSSFTAYAQHPAMSGDWKMNEAKSELGEFGGRMAAKTVKVEQKEDAITMGKTTPGFNGGDPITTTLTLPYDGKIVESEGFGGSKRKSSAKWSDDGQSLTINSSMNFERDGQSFEIKSTETWTMKDGMLTIVTVSTTPRGENTTKAVYRK